MDIRALSLIGAVSLLAGCGGGASVRPLILDADGKGFGLVEADVRGNVFYAAVRDVEDASGHASLKLARMSLTNPDPDGLLRGTVTVRYANGSTAEVPALLYKDVAGIYGRFNDGVSQAIVVGGAKAENLPLGNNFVYKGVAVMSYDTVASASMVTEEGTFSMTVNLIDNVGSISASSAGATYVNNSIAFDTDGTYAGKTGTFTVPADSADRDLALYGSLHGDGGTVVSGAGFSGSAAADNFAYIAILGKRQ